MKNLMLVLFVLVSHIVSAQENCQSSYDLDKTSLGLPQKDSAVSYLKIYFKLIPEIELLKKPVADSVDELESQEQTLIEEKDRLLAVLDTMIAQRKAGKKLNEKEYKRLFAERQKIIGKIAQVRNLREDVTQRMESLSCKRNGIKDLAASILMMVIPKYDTTRKGLCPNAVFLLSGQVIFLNNYLP